MHSEQLLQLSQASLSLRLSSYTTPSVWAKAKVMLANTIWTAARELAQLAGSSAPSNATVSL